MNVKSLFTMFVLAVTATTAVAANRKTLLNAHWQFYLTDSITQVQPIVRVADTLWQDVCLPHDWSIRMPFRRDAAPGNDGGYLPGGVGWYRTVLHRAQHPDGRVVKLYFEGVYERSEVYVNGRLAGGHPYGYTSYYVDVTSFLRQGDNEILVKADNSNQKNCRWYSGSGIYRNVWLVETADVRIADWGVGIQTPDLHTALISVETENTSNRVRTLQVEAEVDGVRQSTSIQLTPRKQERVSLTLRVPQAKPWSVDTPTLYTARVTVKEKGKCIDRVEQPFGFRTISYTASDGFRLNGQPLVLNGGCIHHDNGILGAAAYDRAERRKAELLKKAGFNAVRTSHNLPSETFLQACDEIGLLVIDEAFDGWRDAKNSHDYHLLFDEWAEKDAAAMVLRDRNHPSIFCWSIGNEIMERKKPQAVNDARMLAKVCKSIDPTRPVTQALASWDSDWEIYDPLAAEHDIVGYNYLIQKAEDDHRRVPERVMMQTESYPKDAWENYRTTRDHPYVIGDFVWTAIDYIGESGIGRYYYEGDVEGEHFHRPLYPWHAAYCGDIDLTGVRKPVSHYRSMLWNAEGEKLYLAVREPDGYHGKIQTTMWGTWPTTQSWNWPGHEGKPIEVEVYARYPQVRLYLNGQMLGEQQTAEMKATFVVAYAPGTLLAEGIEDGKVMETTLVKSAGEASDIRLVADRDTMDADGQDLSFILIECVDDEGNVVPTAEHLLTVSVEGSASLVALGNADIKEEDPYYDATHPLWNGRALAVVRNNGCSGKAVLHVDMMTPAGNKVIRTLQLSSRRRK